MHEHVGGTCVACSMTGRTLDAPDDGLSLTGVLILALLHVAAGRAHRGEGTRPTWRSAAGGISIAYVFIHLIPELADAQERWLAIRHHRLLPWLESQVHLVALLGLLPTGGLWKNFLP